MNNNLRIDLQHNIYKCASAKKKLWSLPESKEMVIKYSKELNELKTLKELNEYIDAGKNQLQKLGYDANYLCKINNASLHMALGYLNHNDIQMFDGLWPEVCK